jgi:hypothetical protein
VIGLIKPAADIDKGQCLDDPGCQRGMDEAIEMGATSAAFFDQTVRAQQAKMLGNPRGWQGKRASNTGDILFTAAQLRNQPQPIGMGQQLEQISQLARDNQLAGHKQLAARGKFAARGRFAGLWPGIFTALPGMAPSKYLQNYAAL